MTGLFFGSFNPIHNGHLQIARYLLNQKLCDEIWFIISPQNPFKQNSSLLDETQRLKITETALKNEPGMKACNVEFSLPRPSYTIDTLRYISQQYPHSSFALIIGEDNLRDFHLWRDYPSIYQHYKILVYPRPGITATPISYPNITRVDAPLTSISSTEIRQRIQQGRNISNFVPENVLNLILKSYT